MGQHGSLNVGVQEGFMSPGTDIQEDFGLRGGWFQADEFPQATSLKESCESPRSLDFYTRQDCSQ